MGGGLQLPGPSEPLGQPVNQLAIVWREVLEEAVDRFHNHAPLGETGDSAERVEARFEFDRHSDTKLRVVFDLLSVFRSRGRAAGSATFFGAIVGRHSQARA